jgi:hypothetical protein
MRWVGLPSMEDTVWFRFIFAPARKRWFPLQLLTLYRLDRKTPSQVNYFVSIKQNLNEMVVAGLVHQKRIWREARETNYYRLGELKAKR